ncbi:hypothetical protein F4778DRAFT_621135 [Xylariomycetidae sp. FL2044]|nr:hypothetical protein F4778DRAFT_621135 [Xylariomycetidae sp. FL2044]
MSLRIPVPLNDPRSQQAGKLAISRTSSQRNAQPSRVEQLTTPTDSKKPPVAEPPPSPSLPYRSIVIPDPVAFRYLEEDQSVNVIERRENLRGYELYLVEQWACSRKSATLVIATYTGDEKHSIVVGVLGIPADEKTWSARLRIYFKAVQQYHARPKDTPLGELVVTNLSSFPSALTVISVPEGDIKEQRRVFIVNEDLKRLGCSGRSGMTLSEPSGAAKAKFYQLYKVDDRIPFSDAVVELVKLCQVALSLFGKLDPLYIDGLLCDMTETAVADWWTECGADYFNAEPTDGILGPTTVVALIGLLMGARNRLSYFGAPVQKDVFDIDATEKGVAYFQKYQKLERTRRLDRQTMHKLHAVTAKAAAGEGWGVQKAVKSTVSEIGGKRGEMVLGIVGGKDKGGIGGIETLDFDRFITLASGERAKWLWHGKAKRTPLDQHEKSLPDMSAIFGKDEMSSQARRVQSAPLEEEVEPPRRDELSTVYSTPPPGSAISIVESPVDKDALRRGVFKNVARDARSGLGRIKDAVYSGGGLRGHASRQSRDDSSDTPLSGLQSSILSSPLGPAPVPGQIGRAFTWKNKPEEYVNAARRDREVDTTPDSGHVSGADEAQPGEPRRTARVNGEARGLTNGSSKTPGQSTEVRNEAGVTDSSVADSIGTESDVQGHARTIEDYATNSLSTLRRRNSVSATRLPVGGVRNEARWPRRLSFGDAEEAVLRWEEITDYQEGGELELEEQRKLADLARSLYLNMADIKQELEPWVEAKIKSIEMINSHYARQYDKLQAVYYERTEDYQRAKHSSEEIVGEQRAHMTEAVKDVEMQAAKLEYEINALVSRVQDVEDGVVQFEAQVDAVERRAEEVKRQLEAESWLHWAVRTITGIGTGPNITRPRSQR